MQQQRKCGEGWHPKKSDEAMYNFFVVSGYRDLAFTGGLCEDTLLHEVGVKVGQHRKRGEVYSRYDEILRS